MINILQIFVLILSCFWIDWFLSFFSHISHSLSSQSHCIEIIYVNERLLAIICLKLLLCCPCDKTIGVVAECNDVIIWTARFVWFDSAPMDNSNLFVCNLDGFLFVWDARFCLWIFFLCYHFRSDRAPYILSFIFTLFFSHCIQIDRNDLM